MNQWTVNRDVATGNWTLKKNGEICQAFYNYNGSPQSSRKKCERELALHLVNGHYKDYPETGYRTAYLMMKLAEESGAPISIECHG